MQLPLRVCLKPSRRLAVLLALLHLAAIAALAPLDVPAPLRLAAGGLVVLSAVAGIRRHAMLLSPLSARELILGADGSVEVTTAARGSFRAAVSVHSTVFPWLAVLLLRTAGSWRPVPVVVLPDSLEEGAFRSVRSWLRWKASPSGT